MISSYFHVLTCGWFILIQLHAIQSGLLSDVLDTVGGGVGDVVNGISGVPKTTQFCRKNSVIWKFAEIVKCSTRGEPRGKSQINEFCTFHWIFSIWSNFRGSHELRPRLEVDLEDSQRSMFGIVLRPTWRSTSRTVREQSLTNLKRHQSPLNNAANCGFPLGPINQSINQ